MTDTEQQKIKLTEYLASICDGFEDTIVIANICSNLILRGVDTIYLEFSNLRGKETFSTQLVDDDDSVDARAYTIEQSVLYYITQTAYNKIVKPKVEEHSSSGGSLFITIKITADGIETKEVGQVMVAKEVHNIACRK